MEEYLTQPEALVMEEMAQIHRLMLQEMDRDADAQELYLELLKKANEYAQIRSSWYLMPEDERWDTDERRTMVHDSLIVKFNQLARYLKMQGKEAVWRDMLKDEKENPYIRKRIGDMGCYLVFISSLHAR